MGNYSHVGGMVGGGGGWLEGGGGTESGMNLEYAISRCVCVCWMFVGLGRCGRFCTL